MYLDDSGSPGNPEEEYFVLGGGCVYEAQVDWFTREVDKIATAYNAVDPAEVEFHASEIFARRESPWDKLTATEARGVLKTVLRMIPASYETARLFACAVHKPSFPNHDPVELAFEDLCQRFDIFLSRLRQTGDAQRGLVILDRTTRETSLRKLSREFRAGFTTQVFDRVRDASAPGGTRLVGPTPVKLPVAVMFVGRPFSEPLLFRIGSAYEAATHHRTPPPDFGPVRQ